MSSTSSTTSQGARGRSPQSVDPLSWYTGPLIPLALAALVIVYGTILSITTAGHSSNLAVQLVATAICASACGLVYFATRPKQPQIGWLLSATALVIALCGCQLSASGYRGAALPVEQWWAPGAISLTVVSLAPYLSIRRLLVLGLAATAAVGVIGAALFPLGSGPWSPVGTIVVLVTTPLTGLAAASVFTVIVVNTMLRMLVERQAPDERRSQCGADGANPTVANLVVANPTVERAALARLTVRVVPFLEQLAASGRVTATDRAVAGQLARRLRTDLVARVNESWLDTLTAGRAVVVMDSAHRAETMNAAQKTAMTGLITAILETPDSESKSILIELRGQENGATAVGISMDLALPEGRRTMHLAPYYLSLKTAFDGLSWSEGRLMNMSFEAPPVDGGASKA